MGEKDAASHELSISLKHKMEEEKDEYEMYFRSFGRRISSGSESTFRICRVPQEIKQSNESAYVPKAVSIGPLHRQQHKDSEWIKKLMYTQSLLQRTKDEDAARARCFQKMLGMEASARTYYAPEDTGHLDQAAFAEMMLIDGCFIIELLYRLYNGEWEYDPILTDESRFNQIRNDLILLENQIPFIVLHTLFYHTVGVQDQNRDPSFASCVLFFFGNPMGLEYANHSKQTMAALTKIEERARTEDNHQLPWHILHLLHMLHMPSPAFHQANQSSTDGARTASERRISATKLDSDGLKLHKGNAGNLFHLKFTRPCWLSRLWKRCGLQIPSFIIQDSTETFLRNMIAFEQCCHGIDRFFTSHAFLMDQLINSAADVRLLEDAGIITNYLDDRKKVDRLFLRICKNVYLGHDFKFKKQRQQVIHYCDRSWHTHRQKFMRHYFSSPWAGISVVAALVLFLLALLQTIYTMLSYY